MSVRGTFQQKPASSLFLFSRNSTGGTNKNFRFRSWGRGPTGPPKTTPAAATAELETRLSSRPPPATQALKRAAVVVASQIACPLRSPSASAVTEGANAAALSLAAGSHLQAHPAVSAASACCGEHVYSTKDSARPEIISESVVVDAAGVPRLIETAAGVGPAKDSESGSPSATSRTRTSFVECSSPACEEQRSRGVVFLPEAASAPAKVASWKKLSTADKPIPATPWCNGAVPRGFAAPYAAIPGEVEHTKGSSSENRSRCSSSISNSSHHKESSSTIDNAVSGAVGGGCSRDGWPQNEAHSTTCLRPGLACRAVSQKTVTLRSEPSESTAHAHLQSSLAILQGECALKPGNPQRRIISSSSYKDGNFSNICTTTSAGPNPHRKSRHSTWWVDRSDSLFPRGSHTSSSTAHSKNKGSSNSSSRISSSNIRSSSSYRSSAMRREASNHVSQRPGGGPSGEITRGKTVYVVAGENQDLSYTGTVDMYRREGQKQPQVPPERALVAAVTPQFAKGASAFFFETCSLVSRLTRKSSGIFSSTPAAAAVGAPAAAAAGSQHWLFNRSCGISHTKENAAAVVRETASRMLGRQRSLQRGSGQRSATPVEESTLRETGQCFSRSLLDIAADTMLLGRACEMQQQFVDEYEVCVVGDPLLRERRPRARDVAAAGRRLLDSKSTFQWKEAADTAGSVSEVFSSEDESIREASYPESATARARATPTETYNRRTEYVAARVADTAAIRTVSTTAAAGRR